MILYPSRNDPRWPQIAVILNALPRSIFPSANSTRFGSILAADWVAAAARSGCGDKGDWQPKIRHTATDAQNRHRCFIESDYRMIQDVVL